MKVNIALLTVTDTRTIDNDKSGGILVNKIKESNHNLIDRKICKDNKDEIVLILKEWLKNEKIDINVDIGTGKKNFKAYTMDLTKKYIEINADYLT